MKSWRELVLVRYQLHGRGPNRILALHGWLGDGRGLRSAIDALDADRFTVAIPDARGYGAELGALGPFDIETVARDTIAVADSLGWQTFSLVGHSMGGKCALRVAIESPERVDRIIGIAPVWAGSVAFGNETIEALRTAIVSREFRELVIDASTGERLPRSWLAKVTQTSFEVCNPEAMAGYLESWMFDDFSSAAATLTNPTLVIIGAHDPQVTVTHIEETWLSSMAHVRLLVLNDAGHYPMDECPLILASHIAAFAAGER